jgi:hypothetical protein
MGFTPMGIAIFAVATLLGNTAGGMLHQLLNPIPPTKILIALVVLGSAVALFSFISKFIALAGAEFFW